MKDIYVKFDSPAIKGESQDKDHKDWIEINSWSQAISQPRSATASTAGGHTAERCEHRDMVFTKDLDVVSPLLYQQMIGRGLRGPLNGGKERCLIVNVADNVLQFGEELAFRRFDYLWRGFSSESP